MRLMKLMKRLISISTALVMVFTLSSTVLASAGTVEVDKSETSGETVLHAEDSDGKGSITIQLEDTKDKLPKNGVVFEVVKVADVVNGLFELDDKYAESGVDLNKIDSANELDIAAAKLVTLSSGGDTVVTDENGKIVVKDLEVGVYLLYATDTAKYDKVSPILVSIPSFNNKTGSIYYDVEVLPKHTPKESGSPVKPSVPQTGLEDNVSPYVFASVMCFLGFLLVYVPYRMLNRKKTK